MNWLPGSHASTFGGNPVSCQAMLATIRLLEDGLMNSTAKQGDYMINGVEKLECTYPIIGDVRGLGLMLAAEIVKDKETKNMRQKCEIALSRSIFKRTFAAELRTQCHPLLPAIIL